MKSSNSLLHTAKWAFAMNWGQQGIAMAVMLVLASLLGPGEFGTVALATVIIAFMEMVLRQGMESALIQRRDLQPLHIDSVFWFIMGLSVLLAVTGMAIGGLWAGHNDRPEIALIVRILTFSIILEGLTIVQSALLKRDLKFKYLAVRSNVAEFTGGVAGIFFAFAGFGMWALVVYQLSRKLVSTCLLWRFGTWKPSLRFSKSHFKQLIGFSASSFASSMASFLQRNTDTLIVGAFFGPAAVGLLRLADRVKEAVLSLLTRPITSMVLSVLSKEAGVQEALRGQYLKLLRMTSCLTLPAMGLLFCNSELILSFLGPEWRPAGRALSLLAIVGAIQAFTMLTIPTFQAKSKPHFAAAMAWSLAVLNTAAFFWAARSLRDSDTNGQVEGFSLVRVAVFAGFYLPLNLYLIVKATGATLQQVLKAVEPGLTAAMTVVGLFLILRTESILHLLGNFSLIIAGVLSAIAGLGVLFLREPALLTLVSRMKSRVSKAESSA